MKELLIVFHSMTGGTRQMAEAAARGAAAEPEVRVRLLRASAAGAQDVLQGVAHAHATLAAGFTTVRDVGAYRAFTDVALRDAINAGIVAGPRMFVAGAYITVSRGGGECG